MALAVIAARGGSKGLPGKNLRQVGGVPLIGRAVDAAVQARSIGTVVVSTDDGEIAAVAAQHGAEIVWRPRELATDTATSESAWLHVLEGYETDILVALQCTSPFIEPEDIDGSVALVEQGADCVFTVAPTHVSVWEVGPFGPACRNLDAFTRPPRQDRLQYVETGAVYAMRTDGFRKTGRRFFGRMAMYVMPRERAVEIDDEHDLRVANALAEVTV
jgi:N-acylneuraminate cytidylyltransferase